MRFFSHSEEIPRALTYGQKILAADPLREDVHRQMMRMYMRNGQRSLAVKQYNTCFESLKAELGIPPMPETQELFLHITENHKAASSDPLPASWEIHQAISDLHSAMDRAYLAQQNLEKVMEQIYKTFPRDTTIM
jgi:DNA-binding SARP family transcriptional activator